MIVCKKNIDVCAVYIPYTNVYIVLYFLAFVKEMGPYFGEIYIFTVVLLQLISIFAADYCCIFASFSARVLFMFSRSL